MIAQLITAHAWHEAVSTGASTERLARPKSVGYGIGLAVVLAALMISSNWIQAYAQQISAMIGIKCRSAVRSAY
jgi:hypothetical protein